jgi:hypothetical protein
MSTCAKYGTRNLIPMVMTRMMEEDDKDHVMLDPGDVR